MLKIDSLDPDSLEPRYYAYFDENKKRYFYHDPVTNNSTWHFPSRSIVIDSETEELISSENQIPEYHSDLNDMKEMIKNVAERANEKVSTPIRSCASSPRFFDQSPEGCNQRKKRRDRFRTVVLGDIINKEKGEIALPQVFYKPPEYDQDLIFASKNNKEIHFSLIEPKLRVYSIKKVKLSVDSLMTYEIKSSHIPLLQSTTNSRAATVSYNFIVSYGKQSKKDSYFILKHLANNLDLIDEVYLQLIKATRNNSDLESTYRIYDLLLIVTQFFTPSQSIYPFLTNYFVIMSNNTQKVVAEIAMKCYVHIHARYASKVNISIPQELTNRYNLFIGASLYELMLTQSDLFPDNPLPTLLVRLIVSIKAKNGLTEFKKNKDKIVVDNLVDMINEGKDTIIEVSPLDMLISILERWIMALPDPLIPVELIPDFKKALTTQTIEEAVEKMPFVHKMAFLYIVGFLQEISKARRESDPNVDVDKVPADSIETLIGVHLFRGSDDGVLQVAFGKVIIHKAVTLCNTELVYPMPQTFTLRYPNQNLK